MDYQKLQNGSDIRGVAFGRQRKPHTAGSARFLAAAFAEWLSARGTVKPKIAIGMDSRVTGPSLKQACIGGFTAVGADVVDCGMASTPAMFMTTVTEGFLCDGAVMVTASHLPMNRNGLKFFTRDGGLEKGDIAELIRIAADIDSSGAAKRQRLCGGLYERIRRDFGG